MSYIKKFFSITTFFAIIIFFCYFNVSTVYAQQSKDINIDLDKDYNICQFNIQLPDTRHYKISITGFGITDPITCENEENEDTVSMTVNNCKKGTYTVHFEIVSNENNEENNSTDEEPIGVISISVSASRDTAESISSEIKVARDIVGLKTYFKDNNICVEWDDKNVGNVNINIIDTKTHEVIYSTTEAENKYVEFPLEKGVKQITVSVVPAESEGISDAVKQFTLETPERPNASVSFNDLEYTNNDTITAHLMLDKAYEIIIYVNDKMVLSNEYVEPGISEKEIPLEDDANNIIVYLVDDDHNMFSYTKSIIHDVIAPTLMISNNYDGMQTYDENVIFNGTVQDATHISFNNVEGVINADGTFTYSYPLHEGTNLISIMATDEAGNESIYEATVIRLLPEEKSRLTLSQIAKIILYSVIGILAVIVFIVKKQQRKKKEMEKILRQKEIAQRAPRKGFVKRPIRRDHSTDSEVQKLPRTIQTKEKHNTSNKKK